MKVYFIGIGGIGVSALARKYLQEGWQVYGSDKTASKITTELEKLGAKISLEQKAENITADFDLVIYTIALPDDQAEWQHARELKLKILSYPEALGELSKNFFTIAIVGTHGKTTTTAMLAKMATEAKLEPTVIVGSLLAESGSNFIAGASQYLIVEACEYRRSFLNLRPKILIITNIDMDHLDYYHDLADIQSAFAELASFLPESGALICDKTDALLAPVIAKAKCKVIDYSKIKTDFSLKIPGQHNVKNAQAALAAAEQLNLPYLPALEALESFAGTWRRFERRGETTNGVVIYDDYAHHPSEIKATLAGARELVIEKESEDKKKKIFVVFQPHLYSRTKLLFNDFAQSFVDADRVIITDIYAAREKSNPEISSERLAQAIGGNKAVYLKDFAEIADWLKRESKLGDVIIVMGAGDISQLVDRLL